MSNTPTSRLSLSRTGRCAKPFSTINVRASDAGELALAHCGFGVMICSMVVELALSPAATARKAKSLAVKIPARSPKSLTTRIQFSLLAVINWDASKTVDAGLHTIGSDGFNDNTVPGAPFLCAVDLVNPFLFLFKSFSILRAITSSFADWRLRESDNVSSDASAALPAPLLDLYDMRDFTFFKAFQCESLGSGGS